MTVSSSTNKVSYSGNGTLTTFAYSFKIFDQDDLTVILRAADGTETTQTITTHYTVTGVGSASGGNVVFGTAPASGVTVVIIREQPLTQGLDLVPNDPFPAQSLEESLDKLTFMAQKHEEELSRAIKGSRTNVISNSEFTISATDRANKVFSFDASGNLSVTQELGTFKGNWATSTTYVARDIVKDTSTNNIFLVNADHTSSGAQPLTTNANSAKYDLIVDAASATTSASAAATSAASAASSATAAAASETASAASEAAAATSETNSANSATASAASATSAAASYDSFDDRYLGAKSTSGGNPTQDNDGDALIDGALFYDTTNNVMMVYNLGTTTWLRTTPTSSDQTTINNVNSNISNINTVAGISSNVTTVAGISANVTTVAGQTTNLQNVTDNLSAIQNASTNATNAASSATASASSATAAAASQTAAAASAASAATSYDSFDDRYLGVKSSDPTADNDGDALASGMLYFSSSENIMKVYDGASWIAATSAGNVSLTTFQYTATGGQTTFSGSDDNSATLSYTVNNILVTLNGSLLFNGTDYTATNGTSVVLASGAVASDVLQVTAFKSFTTADMVPASTGGTFAGNVAVTGDLTVDTSTLKVDSSNNRVGIGTTSPYTLLELSSTDPILRFNDSNGGTDTKNFELRYVGTSSPDIDGLYFRTVNDANNVYSDKMAILGSGNVGIGTSSPEGLISVPATASNTPKFRLQSATTNTDFAISSYADANGTYVSLGANHYLNSSGNDAVFETTDRSAFILLDARNAGAVIFGTNSSGIAAERARISSSGDLLLGLSSTEAVGTNAGTQLRADGLVYAAATSDAHILSRRSTDGSILNFRKDTTTVGGISTWNSRIGLFQGNTRIELDDDNDAAFFTNNSTGALRDGTTDLGKSDARIRNLYLSSGVFLGGTGAANQLEDYEEGTFTPTFGGSSSDPTVSYSAQVGSYVKIGKLVYLNVSVIATGTPSGGNGDLIITNLPFTSKSGVQQSGSIAFANNMTFGNSGTQGYCNIEGSVAHLNINSQEFSGTSSMSRVPVSGIHHSGPRIVCSICYETA